MLGVEIRDFHSTGKLKPFGRLLAGIDRQRRSFSNAPQEFINLLGGKSFSSTAFAADIGGGVDLAIGHSIDLRLVEVDYRHVAGQSHKFQHIGQTIDTTLIGLSSGSSIVSSLQDLSSSNKARSAFTVSAGLVFHIL